MSSDRTSDIPSLFSTSSSSESLSANQATPSVTEATASTIPVSPLSTSADNGNIDQLGTDQFGFTTSSMPSSLQQLSHIQVGQSELTQIPTVFYSGNATSPPVGDQYHTPSLTGSSVENSLQASYRGSSGSSVLHRSDANPSLQTMGTGMTYRDLYGGGNDKSHVDSVRCPNCTRPCDSAINLASCGHEICLACLVTNAYAAEAGNMVHQGVSCPVCGKISKLDDRARLLLRQSGDDRVKKFYHGQLVPGTMMMPGAIFHTENGQIPMFGSNNTVEELLTVGIDIGPTSYAVYSDYRCEVHMDEPVKYWCVTCRSRLLCSKCCIGRGGNRNHSNHKILLLDEAFKLVEFRIENEILPKLESELMQGNLLAKQAQQIIEEGTSTLKQIFVDYKQSFVPRLLEMTRANTKKCLGAVQDTVNEIKTTVLKPMIGQDSTPPPIYIKYSSPYTICKWYSEAASNERLRLTAQSQRGQLALVDLALRWITEKCSLRKYLAVDLTSKRQIETEDYDGFIDRTQHSAISDSTPARLFKISRK